MELRMQMFAVDFGEVAVVAVAASGLMIVGFFALLFVLVLSGDVARMRARRKLTRGTRG